MISLLGLIEVTELTLIHLTHMSVELAAALIGAREVELDDPHVEELSP